LHIDDELEPGGLHDRQFRRLFPFEDAPGVERSIAHAGLKEAGFETVLLETRHVKAALSAMTVKTDRKDARGLAQLLRMGWFQQEHAKSMASQEVRALLVGRKQLLGGLIDVELSIRGILRGFGLKVGAVTRKKFEARIRELVT
jgi:transposase